MKYQVDDKPPLGQLLLYALQWWVVALPCVIITGVVTSRLHYGDLGSQIWYLQKLFVVTGLIGTIQVLWGHKLPLIIGPATVILVGIVASISSGIDAIYTSIFLGGLMVTILGATNILSKLRVFFTTRIVIVILILIVFTLAPIIVRLVSESGGTLIFSLLSLLILVSLNEFFKGAQKALTVLVGLILGTIVYGLIFGISRLPSPEDGAANIGNHSFFISFSFEPGTILAFIFCFLALMVNELGSVEAVGRLLSATDMDRRVKKGVIVAGGGNILSGLTGVIGMVDFSLSAGLVMASGCASRYAMVPAWLLLLACGFFPKLIQYLAVIPNAVMGTLLLYTMVSQFGSGLSMLVKDRAVTDFKTGCTIGLPLLVGLAIAFSPEAIFEDFPALLRPIVQNGFVMGAFMVIFLEHLVFRDWGKREKP
ncbi:MAG: purine/pyrimidine permease [Deltaproteobacteria bacterium]|jgi:xanthine/uracil permease|nr:purine/pyrimidine permease [Deltaproteobacteria bacterium]